jgi:hypothetical protein
VKVESNSPEEETSCRLREQEKVSTDYRDSGDPAQRSRSSENIDTGQQGPLQRLRSSENIDTGQQGHAQRSRSNENIDTGQQEIVERSCDEAAQNDAARSSSSNVINRPSEGQPCCPQDTQIQQSATDHRNYSYRFSHLGQQKLFL